ncbi:MAG: energy transducer TonB [Chitinophagales bacterium]|nr:energy transducer TonB [Chitinophagales bacterium]
MMKKPAFFFLFLPLFLIQPAQCQEKDTLPVPACTPVYVPPPGMMLSSVEEQPYLKQCEYVEKNKRTACSGEVLMSYLTDGLKHPGIPPNVSDTTRALVVVQFYIDTTGYIDEPVRIARDINLGYGSQVLSRVEKMRKDTNMRWQAARLNGRKVKVQYNMPVYYKYFKREQLPSPPPPPPPPSKPKREEVFKVVERMPCFPGCLNLPKAEIDTCAQRKFKEYVFRQLRYPREAYENGKEGDAIIEFVIDKDGSLYDAKVTSDPGYGMGEAALHAIEKMREDRINWVIQSSRGRAVRVLLYHKISFRLDAGITVEE